MTSDERASLDAMLVSLVRVGGSDLHLTVGAPPTVRINGAAAVICPATTT